MHPGGAEKGRCGGGGVARRPWEPRPELRARASSAVLLAREGGAGGSRCAHSGCCAPVAGGLLKPWPAAAPAKRWPLHPSFSTAGTLQHVRPFLWWVFSRAATKQRAPNFATLRVVLAQRDLACSAAQLGTPCSWRWSWSPARRAASRG